MGAFLSINPPGLPSLRYSVQKLAAGLNHTVTCRRPSGVGMIFTLASEDSSGEDKGRGSCSGTGRPCVGGTGGGASFTPPTSSSKFQILIARQRMSKLGLAFLVMY